MAWYGCPDRLVYVLLYPDKVRCVINIFIKQRKKHKLEKWICAHTSLF